MNRSPNIASYVRILASEEPDRKALIYPGGTLTYRELDALSRRCAGGLRSFGFRPRTRTVLMVKPGPEFLVLCFALLRLRAIPVLVDPGMGWRNLRDALDRARPEAFIGTPLAHTARILFGWARSASKRLVTVGRFRFWSGTSYQTLMKNGDPSPDPEESEEEDVGAIVFTTGSTGIPKGVVYTHSMFAAQIEVLRTHFDIEPHEVALETFPLFALFDPALRVTTVFPRMDFTRPGKVDPQEIVSVIQEHGCTHMFGSPALLDRVGRYAEQRTISLPSLKRVLTAGAPVPGKVLQRFSRLLADDSDIHTPYGATEALPVTSISSREVLQEDGPARGKGICVGRPVHGVELAIVRITENPIKEWSDELIAPGGTIGEIAVWGSNVSQRYFELPDADDKAKIPNRNGVLGHRMGDLGYLDDSGRLWFCGRKSHRVITASGTLFTVPCEGVFNQHQAVRRSALVGVGDPPDQKPVLCVELEPGYRKSRRLSDELLALGQSLPQTRTIQVILYHSSFPVDIRHNAKIFREKLAIWAARRV